MLKPKELCLSLVKTDSEKEIITNLKQIGYWDDNQVWYNYGNKENNFAVIGNQQSAADTALVEKIINSIDAVLMRECLREGINPESNDAPLNSNEALEKFFGIRKGVLANLGRKQRNILAQNILIIASGTKTRPCYSIIDKGEGQTPNKMPSTFLSLTESNKLRIPFVQGKFDMGSTGVLQFCGKYNLQLVISRRHPEIVIKEGDDGSSYYWGFTIIRRFDPIGRMKHSAFKYLAPQGKILRFKAKDLPLIPSEYPKTLGNSLKSGTFIKLYEYQLTGLKSHVNYDLARRLSILLPKIVLPILLMERRLGYSAHTHQSVISGLRVKLDENKYNNIEKDFPDSSVLTIDQQKYFVDIYAFKKGKKKSYTRNEGIIFTINGQSHGFIPQSFFSRKRVRMSYLADSIVSIVNCSHLSGRAKENLFMNSRDRLRKGDLRQKIEKRLEKLISEHPGLRKLREKRRREELKGKIGDDKPLVKVLEKLIRVSPTLSKLFIDGDKITNPFNLSDIHSEEEFCGKIFPTHFDLMKHFPKEKPKQGLISRSIRIKFITNAENGYFTREINNGEFDLFLINNNQKIPIQTYSIHLWNGTAKLTVRIPENIQIGDTILFLAETTDPSQPRPFTNEFFVKIIPNHIKSEEEIHRTDREKKKRQKLNLPEIKEVYQPEWERYNFASNSALMVKRSELGYDFYINMDNSYVLTEIKGKIHKNPEIIKAQYKYGMVLISLSLIKMLEGDQEDEEGSISIFDEISKITKGIAPVLVPMISNLSELEEDINEN